MRCRYCGDDLDLKHKYFLGKNEETYCGVTCCAMSMIVRKSITVDKGLYYYNGQVFESESDLLDELGEYREVSEA